MSDRLSIRLVGANPYPETVPDEILGEIIRDVVQHRIDDVKDGFARGDYPRDSLGIVVLDRTAPRSTPTEQTVLFIASYGELGDRLVRNAAAKVFLHRDHGVETASLVRTTPGRVPDGAFRHGPSVLLDGLYVGVSGLDDFQDRYQGVALANELNLRIDTIRLAWHTEASGVWFSETNEPAHRYAAVPEMAGVELT